MVNRLRSPIQSFSTTVWQLQGVDYYIEFVQAEPGRFKLFASTQPVSALKGLVRKPTTPVTVEVMNETIAERGASSK